MDSKLADDRKQFQEILHQTLNVASRHLALSDSSPPGKFIKDIPPEILPTSGIGASAALEVFERKYAGKLANFAGPRYFGFVAGGATPASVAGDWLVSTYDQNVRGSHDSIAPQIEKQTIEFLKQFFRLDDGYFGSFVSGATLANFVGLSVGRQWVGEQHGIDFSQDGLGAVPVKVVSATAHSSIFKSLSMAGLGRQSLIKINTLPDREAIAVDALENYLKQNTQPCIVVANAGTMNTVDFDDLESIGRLKMKYDFWMHVDAAFGGFAACTEEFAYLMRGINHADSITIDAHKWLNVPYDAAMQFTRHRALQLKVFQNSATHLSDPETTQDYFHYTPENSRRFRALPAWFTLMAYGRKGHAEIVERNCALARELGEKLRQTQAFRLLAPVRMNVVCFTLNQRDVTRESVRHLLDLVRDDGRVFFMPTVYRDMPAIRAAICNWQTRREDINLALQVLMECVQKIHHPTIL